MIERVHFIRPLIDDYNDEGYTCVDMHTHTRYSDTFTFVGNIIRKAAKKGIGVSITDHNQIKGNLEAIKKAKKKKVMIIPGMELSLSDGCHLLTYFYSKGELEDFYNKHVVPKKNKNPYMATNISVDDVKDITKDYNCLTSTAHPVSLAIWNVKKAIEAKRINKRFIDDFGAVEVMCGLLRREHNLRAVRWARELGKPITGGSDCHTLRSLGSVVTCAKADDVESFLDSIKKHDNFVAGKETRLGPKFFSNMKTVSKHSRYLRHVGPSMKMHYNLTKERMGNIKPAMKDKIKTVKKRVRHS